jgi:uncharacterized protein YaiI (UPF0178 family)
MERKREARKPLTTSSQSKKDMWAKKRQESKTKKTPKPISVKREERFLGMIEKEFLVFLSSFPAKDTSSRGI